MPTPYRLHGFDVSYFTAKVRPALRYKQIFVEERRADYRMIRERTGFAYIPVVVTPDDEVWQDSTEIYDRLEAAHPDPPLFPDSPVQRVAAHLFEIYTDEFALIPAMHYRWGTPEGESSARARFCGMIGSAEIGNRSADRMVAARFAVGASVEAGPAIEEHTRDLLAALCAHFDVHPYLLGARMSFADCALMGPVYGHFFNDLVSRRLLLETAWQVVGWIDRCNVPNTDQQGDWLADDALAPTFRALLGVTGRDAGPVILEILRAVEKSLDLADGAEFPAPGTPCAASLRGKLLDRVAMPYTLWMLQRARDAYQQISASDRLRVDEALAGTGWEPVLAYQPRHRLAKRDYRLVIDDASP